MGRPGHTGLDDFVVSSFSESLELTICFNLIEISILVVAKARNSSLLLTEPGGFLQVHGQRVRCVSQEKEADRQAGVRQAGLGAG